MEIGARVSDTDGNLATVRYVGPVASSKVKTDEWIGVEWDDNTRGKHDGSCLDESGVFHRYFECAFGAGSFIKQHKLVSGRSFVDALCERYNRTSKEVTEAISTEYALTAKGNQKAIEFVGEDNINKWQQISLMSKVTLPRVNISHAGENIQEIAGHFVYIDIQFNLFHSWLEIAKISSQMPELESYFILGNKLQKLTPEIVATLPPRSFSHIKTFCISKCNLHSWHVVELLKPLISTVEELFMTHSNFEDMPLYDSVLVSGLDSLRRIDISACKIADWAQILSLGKLPCLAEIMAEENPISKILPCPEGFFCALTRFSLSGIQIEDWTDVDRFETYPALSNLRLSEVPFLINKGISESRSATIARVGRLTFLNGSPVTAKERSNAENTYVRRCIRDFDEGADDAVARVIASGLHPRFGELYKRYAADLVALGQSKVVNNIKSDLIEVVLKNLTFIGNGSLEPVTKKLPLSLQVTRLRQLVKQLFAIDPVLQQLSYRLYKDAPPVLLDDDDLTLGQYGLLNGTEIFINEAKST